MKKKGKKTAKGGGGVDMNMSRMSGTSCKKGVTGRKMRITNTTPVGYDYNRTSIKGKK